MTLHHVGIGQVVEATDTGDVVEMLGLGSCVGIFMCVPGKYVVAAHALLDCHKKNREETPGKYVDTAVPHLLELARKAGHSKARLQVSIAGGAQIFAFAGGRPELEIGARNITEAHEAIQRAGMRIRLDDTGGKNPRRATVLVSEGVLTVSQKANVLVQVS